MNYLKAADNISKLLEADVNSRDHTNIPPKRPIRLFQEAKLLSIFSDDTINTKWSTVLQIVQKIAEVDTAIAHILGFHYLISSHPLYRGTNQQKDMFKKVINQQLLFGNSSNPLSKTLFGSETENGVILNGFKTFSTGSHVADYLSISWNDSEDRVYGAIIPINRKGITVKNDWDGFGQKQTGSGTVTFNNVQVEQTEILGPDKMQISALFSQAILLNIYTGAAIGALNKMREYMELTNKNTSELLLRKAGKLYSKVESLKLVVKHTNNLMDDLWKNKTTLTDSERGKFAIEILNTSTFSTEISMDVANKIFEIMGARSAANGLGYDRIWRNLRVLTLHSSLDVKYVHLGRFYLKDDYPKQGFYS